MCVCVCLYVCVCVCVCVLFIVLQENRAMLEDERVKAASTEQQLKAKDKEVRHADHCAPCAVQSVCATSSV